MKNDRMFVIVMVPAPVALPLQSAWSGSQIAACTMRGLIVPPYGHSEA